MNEDILSMLSSKRATYNAQFIKTDYKKWDRNQYLNGVMDFLEMDIDLSDQHYFDVLLTMPYEEVMNRLKSHVLYHRGK